MTINTRTFTVKVTEYSIVLDEKKCDSFKEFRTFLKKKGMKLREISGIYESKFAAYVRIEEQDNIHDETLGFEEGDSLVFSVDDNGNERFFIRPKSDG